MYTGTMIEDLIATVERAESWAAAEPAEMLREEDVDIPVAYLLEPSYGEQLVEVA
ncbi:MAG TPA: hypothetical protein VMT05_12030 [Terriglobales bacterium]|jgi:hypothetical protein|nr:hypothetical protein [Terriglobales bacterium]